MQWFLMMLCYSQISALSDPPQRGLFWQQVGAGAETHSQALCEESKLEVFLGSLP